MFEVINKETRKTFTVSSLLTLLLTLRILVSSWLTLNIFNILHDVKYVKIRALYWKKRKKVKTFDRLQTEVFFLPNIRLPPSPATRPEYGLIKFALCSCIHPERINGILRYFIEHLLMVTLFGFKRILVVDRSSRLKMLCKNSL